MSRISDLEEEVQELRDEIVELQDEIDSLHDEIDSLTDDVATEHKEGYEEGLRDAVRAVEGLL